MSKEAVGPRTGDKGIGDSALGQGTDQTTSESLFQIFLCNSDTRTCCSHHDGEAVIFDKAVVNGSYTKLGSGCVLDNSRC